MTQKQLAEASGLHPNTVAKLERGDQEPAWPAVLALASTLGVSCEAFSQEPPEDAVPRKPGRPAKAEPPTAPMKKGKRK